MKKLLRNPWFFITLALTIPVTAYTSYEWYTRRFQGPPVIRERKPLHLDRLVNQDDLPVQTFSTRQQIIVINFFFTHCPVVCLKMTKELKRVSEAFREDPSIAIVSFSVDPDRDSVQRLNAYISKWKIDDTKWEFVTGDKTTIYQLARNNFGLVAADGGGAIPDFIHSEQLVLLDSEHRIRGFYNGTDHEQTDILINDIKKLKNESSNLPSR